MYIQINRKGLEDWSLAGLVLPNSYRSSKSLLNKSYIY